MPTSVKEKKKGTPSRSKKKATPVKAAKKSETPKKTSSKQDSHKKKEKKRSTPPSNDLKLSREEEDAIQKDIAKIGPKDEARVRREFGEKYGRVGKALMASRYRAVRALAIDVLSLYEMLTEPDYTITWKVKAQITFALGYFISPVDAIPDALPVVGYVDDALVVSYVIHLIRDDLVRYRAFRKRSGRPLPNVDD